MPVPSTEQTGIISILREEGAAAEGANSDITSLSGLTTPLTVGQGGTGVDSLAALKAAVDLSGTNSGDITLGTANGLSLTAQALSLGLADATHAGVVGTGTQTLAGAKTFSTSIAVGASPSPVTKIKKITLSVTPGVLAASATVALSFPASSFSSNAVLFPIPPSSLEALIVPGIAWATAADTANLSLIILGAVTGIARTWTFLVIDF